MNTWPLILIRALMLCPVCNGRRETAPGQGCGACRATGFIPGFTSEPLHGIADLQGGAAYVRVPVPAGAVILLSIQEARGEVAAPYVSGQYSDGFIISSLSAGDRSAVGWLIIG